MLCSNSILGSDRVPWLLGQSSQHRTVRADPLHVTGPHFSGVFARRRCGPSGRRSASGLAGQFATVKSEIGFHYLRMHELLKDENGRLYRGQAGHPGVQLPVNRLTLRRSAEDTHPPLAEITFMPSKLAAGTLPSSGRRGTPRSRRRCQVGDAMRHQMPGLNT